MSYEKPGMLAEIRAAAAKISKALEAPLNGLMDAFYGMSIRVSAHVKRGQSYYTDRDPDTGRRALFLHPLDDIARRCSRDPLVHVEEAVGWIYDDAQRRLDEIPARLEGACSYYGQLQVVRMRAWMEANGVTDARLEAAKSIQRHRARGLEPSISLDDLTRLLEAR